VRESLGDETWAVQASQGGGGGGPGMGGGGFEKIQRYAIGGISTLSNNFGNHRYLKPTSIHLCFALAWPHHRIRFGRGRAFCGVGPPPPPPPPLPRHRFRNSFPHPFYFSLNTRSFYEQHTIRESEFYFIFFDVLKSKVSQ
jgi:hypothetical protein